MMLAHSFSYLLDAWYGNNWVDSISVVAKLQGFIQNKVLTRNIVWLRNKIDSSISVSLSPSFSLPLSLLLLLLLLDSRIPPNLLLFLLCWFFLLPKPSPLSLYLPILVHTFLPTQSPLLFSYCLYLVSL
ncbi:hypothetical protein BCR42DRAFT_152816 [Absidia repens]|uniref:Uncharacterized protein n=1 Tax=Absidia repens TaxID=90262 RepID=A0A1X2I1P5_9FUNG|nr:hypothetical protein BCR42DRAFT_152816 [Absidia repens]